MKIIDICIKYKRYFAAALVGVMIIGMSAGASAKFAPATNPKMNIKKAFTDEKDNKELNTLISSYYSYYAEGDTDNLQKIAYPISDAEISYIQMFSEYVDSYDITGIYSKQGLTDGSYMVSVAVDILYTGQETKAAGTDFFYVETDENKNLYINNLYSAFNQTNSENEMDPSVTALISEYERQDDVAALLSKQQEKYSEAVEKDPTLATFITTTLPATVDTWANNYQTGVAQKQAEEQAQAEKAEADALAAAEAQAEAEAAEAQAEADAAAQAQAEQERQDALSASTEVVTTGKINVRDSASEDGNKLGQLDCGTAVSKLSDEGDWSVIDYNGSNAYVKTEFLTTKTSTEAREVTLSSTINIRYEMGENASKLTVAPSGTVLTVDEDYANGWSKVEVNGKMGFAKTEFLK